MKFSKMPTATKIIKIQNYSGFAADQMPEKSHSKSAKSCNK